MTSNLFSIVSLESKDNLSDSEKNDHQDQNLNIFHISSPNYKNIGFLLNQKSTIEVNIKDKDILSPNTIKNNFIIEKNNSSINENNNNKKLKNELLVVKKYGRKKKDDNSIGVHNKKVLQNCRKRIANCINAKTDEKKSPWEEKGRKKKDDNSIGVHNKYTNDNIMRKIKHLVLKSFVSFFNKKLKSIYKEDIGQNILKKELLPLNKEVKYKSSIKFNQILLKRTLKDIYSDNITTRFTNFPKDHNIKLIQKLVNEKDEEKRIYFIGLFNLTFLDCLRHFRGTISIELLEGMNCFKDIQKEFDNNQDYKTILEYHINNFEKILRKKKPRKRTKNNGEN